MPLPLTVSCLSKIQIVFTFLVPVLAHPGSPGQRAFKRLCVCVLSFSQHVGEVFKAVAKPCLPSGWTSSLHPFNSVCYHSDELSLEL